MANKKSDKQEDEQEVSYDCVIFPWTPFDWCHKCCLEATSSVGKLSKRSHNTLSK